MILSDGTIRRMIDTGELKCILPEGEKIEDIASHIVCASFDLRLGNEIKFFPKLPGIILNPFTTDSKTITEIKRYEDHEDIIVQPGQFLLWATKERFWLPAHIVGRVEGRSSIARLGLLIHITAWFIDPWFWRDNPSTITLEICNINAVPIVIRPGMRICQIAFETMDTDATTPYNIKWNAKYNGQISPQESKLFVSG
jgi:dCTP deaminase